MPFSTRNVKIYFISLCTVVVATLARVAFTPWLDDHLPYVTFFVAVAVSAWVGGLKAALITTFLGFVLAWWLFVPPVLSLVPPTGSDLVGFAMYFMVCLAFALFGEAMLHARKVDAERVADLQNLANHLEEESRRKDEFLAILAHELRNPLAPMRTAAALLSESKTDPFAVITTAKMIERQVSHLARLVDDLLDVSRINYGKFELRREVISVAELIHTAVEEIYSDFQVFEQQLKLSIDENLFIHADPIRITQVLGNLLHNASKFSDKDQAIILNAYEKNDCVVIEVIDHGIGIEPQLMEKIFEMFVQDGPIKNRSTTGSGIGLTLARSLVEMHGGTITVKSEGLGYGSTFTICLPKAEKSLAPPEEKAEIKLSFSCMLIVDDNRDAAVLMAQLLGTMGYKTYTAFDGESAIALAKDVAPDIILLDIGLPGLDGYQICSIIRGFPWGEDIIIIAVSGWDPITVVTQQPIAARFNAYLTKPVNSSDIISTLHDLSGTRRAQ